MKRQFVQPCMKVHIFITENIITTSGTTPTNIGSVRGTLESSMTIEEKLADAQVQSIVLTW